MARLIVGLAKLRIDLVIEWIGENVKDNHNRTDQDEIMNVEKFRINHGTNSIKPRIRNSGCIHGELEQRPKGYRDKPDSDEIHDIKVNHCFISS